MLSIKMKLDNRKLVGAAERFRRQAGKVSLGTAHAIAEEAETYAPKLSGSLAASLYVVGQGEDGYDSMAEAVRALNPKAEVFERFAPSGDEKGVQIAYVVSGVFHGLLVEMGTVKMAAQPYLSPAFEKLAGPHIRAVQRALEGSFRAR